MNDLEFERRLMDAHLSPQAMYLMKFLYEQQVALNQHFDTTTSLVLQLAQSMEGFVKLNETMVSKLKNKDKHDGIDVHSTANDPYDAR